jgi:hypothetical protein
MVMQRRRAGQLGDTKDHLSPEPLRRKEEPRCTKEETPELLRNKREPLQKLKDFSPQFSPKSEVAQSRKTDKMNCRLHTDPCLLHQEYYLYANGPLDATVRWRRPRHNSVGNVSWARKISCFGLSFKAESVCCI